MYHSNAVGGLVSLDEALSGIVVEDKSILKRMALVTVPYRSFKGEALIGQLVVDRELVPEVGEIFHEIFEAGFLIAQIVPIYAFGWDDEASMDANNTSAFNYRYIMGTTRLSNHSLGRAIDINPMQNPYFARDNKVYPTGAVYRLSAPGTITPDGPVVAAFKSRGWIWGGDWSTPVDLQHFEKP
jgi:peptidoglycan LD-endopeptidase CwlK